uniref:Uncharacterized protein n=1 Tax=Mucochytrium quahogii TaxID=96639 RepID=A0A7S2WPI4_9STRA|mmetsp:Transcript_19009/g.31092  ORF Transcript_19009/g.31092 Transcript_19009/m.31092 type:complete len:149 (+) Transcript_19009:296-742(+)|eukprot:CAMPEP_0203744494 /NCGR_PEP_ID=MMETSP0098-20131031/540_1 /ASSEMBLY_ACC=CAM_ASM_000208 /TAXON_ID=96639 /ORGANISM=" , Strain NY0313808BC1" /LENGTH=148 /DNA_ID=CAMNT_0050632023 /DNA_START=281 /DNA_END=727 /DNA_ORIENTATION=-
MDTLETLEVRWIIDNDVKGVLKGNWWETEMVNDTKSEAMEVEKVESSDANAKHQVRMGDEESAKARREKGDPRGEGGYDKFSFQYTGRHDHGMLPKPREWKQFSDLIRALTEAKKGVNEFLTPYIEREAAMKRKNALGKGNEPKKIKT